jgi:RNA polymerase sigma-70 factor (ECF subfamily)
MIASFDPEAAARWHDTVLRVAQRMTDPHSAQDVAQEAFVRLLRTGRTSPEEWTPALVMTVVRRVAVDLARRRSRARARAQCFQQGHMGHSLNSCDASRGASLESAELRRRLACLPREQSEAVVLTFVRGLSDEQVARGLSLSRAAVGARRRAGLEALRRTLEGEAAA